MARQATTEYGSVGKVKRSSGNTAASLVLGALAVGLAAANLTGTALPLLAGEREWLIALAVISLAMCGCGPLGQIAARNAWLSWGGLGGSLLGIATLAVIGAGLGLIALPFVASAQAAFNFVAGLIVLKVVLGVIWRLAR